MDWSSERYVRVYTRDSTTWKILDWKARSVLMLMFRKVDRVGVLDVGGRGTRGLAAILELPIEIAKDGIDQLLAEECVVERGAVYVIPNFLEAQEAVQAPAHRSREYRERKRARALGIPEPTVTKRDASVTKSDETVTSRHATSRDVTPDRTVPIRTEPEDPEPERGRVALSVVPSPWVPQWLGPLAEARALAIARKVDVDASVVAFNAHADGKRWTHSERPARLAAWLARERTPGAEELAARANAEQSRRAAEHREVDKRPPNVIAMTQEEREEFGALARRLAGKPNADREAG